MEQKMISSQKKGGRVLSFEAMRLLAIFLVIFTHTDEKGYFLFSLYPPESFQFWGYMLPSMLCSFAVPLFFTVSGALMLGRTEEPLWVLWKKRVIRYGVLLVAVCFLYYLQFEDFRLSKINLKEFLIILYAYSSGGITWFMYAYLAYLITLPFLRSLVQNLKTVYFYYLLGLAFLFKSVVPMAEYLIWQGNVELNGSFAIDWIMGTAVFYPILGYYLEHRMSSQNKKRTLLALWTVEILTLVCVSGMTYYFGQVEGGYAEGTASKFFCCSDLITCLTVYLSMKYGMESVRLPDWLQRVIRCGGACTFGIYLLHLFVMKLPAGKRLLRTILGTGMDALLAALLFCLCVMAVCWGLTWILKKIPVLRDCL